MSTHLELVNAKQKIDLASLKAFFPAVFGTIVEYYDYTLYGFCASLLAAQFFPTDDPTVALLKTFGIFLTGSLAKPLGALLFGFIGDRFGRSIALKISMLGIAIPTTAIGLMPTYQDIGWIAPCLLLLCRILQGILTAGESDTVRIFIFESFFKSKPCFANSLSNVSIFVGIYLASKASAWVMAAEDPNSAWRIAFIVGGMMGAVVFCLRFTVSETVDYVEHLNARVKTRSSQSWNGFFKVFIDNKRMILTAILFCGASGGTYHFYLVFLGKYLSSTLNILDSETASRFTSTAVLIYTLCLPIGGFLADRFGLVRIIKTFFYGLCVALGLNIMMVLVGQMPLWLMWVTAGILAVFQDPMCTIVIQRIEVGDRCRCLSFGHATGSILFSGSAPFISLWLWQSTQNTIAPFLYFGLLASMGFLGTFLIKQNTVPTVAER
ncbi:MAG: MFS transporter [Gammaproteobacteria bacterium]|nr:MFS transporter [Gammaproteobacteria bacterium]